MLRTDVLWQELVRKNPWWGGREALMSGTTLLTRLARMLGIGRITICFNICLLVLRLVFVSVCVSVCVVSIKRGELFCDSLFRAWSNWSIVCYIKIER